VSTYALIEIVVVAALVGASGFAMALRLLPAVWLKAPLGRWLDHAGRPMALRRVGARWRSDGRSSCASGCCPTGNGCAIGRDAAAAAARTATRIPIRLTAD